jgi:hypothetical protein
VAWLERFPRLPAMLVLTAVVVALNIPTLLVERKVSQIDEREHMDLMLRGSHGRIGHNGQVFTQETLRELCIRGSELFVEWPPCKPGRLDPLDYAPETRGRNNSGQDPPYYVVTGLTARALRALTPGWESLVTWGRVLGSVWLLIGMYLVLRAGDLLALDRKRLVVVLIFVAALPTQLHASTTVNPDGTAFLAGAGILLAGLAWERGRASLIWLVVVSALALWIDRANAAALLVVLVYLGLTGWERARSKSRVVPSLSRRLVAGATVAVAVIAVVGTWQAVERRLRPEEPAMVRTQPGRPLPPELTPVYVDSLPGKEMFSAQSIFGMLPPVPDVAPPLSRKSAPNGGPNAVWYGTFSSAAFLTILGVLGAGIFWLAADPVRALAAAAALALIIMPIFTHLYNYFEYGYYVVIVPRFGLCVLPAIALVFTAVASRSRIAFATLGVIAVGLYGTALLTL